MATRAVRAGAGLASGKDGSHGGDILVSSEAPGETTGNGGCDVAANSDGAQAGSSDCATGMGNRSAEFGWDCAWSTGNRPGGMGRTRLGNGPAGMGNGSGVGAVMADMAGGSTEGTGSGGITGFSGA